MKNIINENTVGGNNIITENTTLAELISILGPVTKAAKTPTSKALKEEAKGKTVLLVSHRKSTMRVADTEISM